MSEFKRVLIETEIKRYCNDFDKSVGKVVSLNESILARSEVLDVFDSAEDIRHAKSGPSKISLAQDFYKKTLVPKLKDMVKNAQETELAKAIAAGGEAAKQTIGIMSQHIDSGIKDLQAKMTKVPDFNEFSVDQSIRSLKSLSDSTPSVGAFVIGVIATADSLASRDASAAVIKTFLDGALKIAKGKTGSVQAEAVELEEGPMDFMKKKLDDIKTKVSGSSEEITKDELLDVWKKEYSSSTDSDDIVELLKSKGFTTSQVKKIFNDADVDASSESDSDEAIVDLANKIKEQGLQASVSRWLNSNKDNIMKSLSEGIDLNENKLSDKQIRDIFNKISKLPEPKPATQSESIEQWGRYINQISETKADRLYFANKVIDCMTNNSSVSDLLENKNILPESLNNGRVVTMKVYRKCEKLIKECNLSWNDFMTRPLKIANHIKFKPTVFQRGSLSETVVGRKRTER